MCIKIKIHIPGYVSAWDMFIILLLKVPYTAFREIFFLGPHKDVISPEKGKPSPVQVSKAYD